MPNSAYDQNPRARPKSAFGNRDALENLYRQRQPSRSEHYDMVKGLINSTSPRLTEAEKMENIQRSIADVEKTLRVRELERHKTRKWKAGDVYAPHDLSSVEMEKWRRRKTSERDVFDMLGMNPIDEYKNFSIMAEFMTPTGRIKHRRVTGLRAVNQRKIAKAIRRAVGMGLMPSVHKHPEILEMERRVINVSKFGNDGSRGILKGQLGQ